MIRVAVIGRLDKDIQDVDCYLIRESLQKLLIKNGMIPVILTPIDSKRKILSLLKTCDGIVLPGGDTWTHLDEVAVDFALQKKVPILGICLGMQVMGIGKDPEKFLKNQVFHHKTSKVYAHRIKLDKNSHLYQILGKSTIFVNSRHKDTILVDKKWKVSARSLDGVVEAIEFSNHPFCIGVQWHPEDIFDRNTKKLFRAFQKACKKYKKSYNRWYRLERRKIVGKGTRIVISAFALVFLGKITYRLIKDKREISYLERELDATGDEIAKVRLEQKRLKKELAQK